MEERDTTSNLHFENNSHLTAIHRKTIPAPTRYLLNQHLLEGDILDFGCGLCHSRNRRYFECDNYDPYWRPKGATKAGYDTIICNYVLNVIPDGFERVNVLKRIQGLLNPNGKAFVTVRRFAKSYGWKQTRRKTWQGPVTLPLPIVHKTSHYVTYLVEKQ